MYDNLINYVHNKLDMLDRKAATGDNLEDYELQCGDLLAHLEKSLRTSAAMAEADGGYSARGGRSYADGYNDPMMHMRGMPRGMSYNGSSYGDGRGMMRGGYSRADRMDDVVQAMGNAMADMPEDLRREAQRFLSRMQQV